MIKAALLAFLLLGAACGEDQTDRPPTSPDTPASSATATDEARTFPDVIDVSVTAIAGKYTFDVTISSPYDGPGRYADAFRVVGPDGTVYGIRELTHHHAGEQPFTRSLGNVEIPEEVTVVIVEGRDLENGWGGGTVEVSLPSP